MANYHVIKRSDGSWAAKKDHTDRDSSRHSTQHEAAKAAKGYAIKNGGGEVSIHARNGQIRDKNTYGKIDHFPPRG